MLLRLNEGEGGGSGVEGGEKSRRDLKGTMFWPVIEWDDSPRACKDPLKGRTRPQRCPAAAQTQTWLNGSLFPGPFMSVGPVSHTDE